MAARPDVASSKFEEYRDVVRGVSMPAFRLFGSDSGLRFDLRGQNVKQLDERYTGYLKTDFFAVAADYNSIVHHIGNDGRTMLVQQSPGVWRMSPTLQQTFQNIWESTTNANRVFTTFVAPLFTPSIVDGSTVDVQVLRERTDIVVDLARNQPFSAKVNYRREQRHGSGGLSSNYISYEIETPSVTEYLTQDVGFDAVARPAVGQRARRAALQLVHRPGAVAGVRQPVPRHRRAVGDGRHGRRGDGRRRTRRAAAWSTRRTTRRTSARSARR